MGLDDGGDDFLAEVDGVGILLEGIEQYLLGEHVDAHRRDEGLLRRDPGGDAAVLRHALADLAEALEVGLLFEPGDAPGAVEQEDPHLRRRLGIARLRGDRHLGILLDVIGDQLAEVHPVQVIAGEDEDVVGRHRVEVPPGLAHGVGGALEPGRAVGGLLGGEDVDEPLARSGRAGSSAPRDDSARRS